MKGTYETLTSERLFLLDGASNTLEAVCTRVTRGYENGREYGSAELEVVSGEIGMFQSGSIQITTESGVKFYGRVDRIEQFEPQYPVGKYQPVGLFPSGRSNTKMFVDIRYVRDGRDMEFRASEMPEGPECSCGNKVGGTHQKWCDLTLKNGVKK